MGEIVLLDEHTINKIAAGEVVDRPSSIVKELVENSIDAGAKKIVVEIKNGGISYIKITDNGKGFASDDVELAFERHATSKIRKEEDLHSIKSMGFRGEALASIASISKVSLVSKNINESVGVKARVEAGNILQIESCAASQGTIIEIRDVFYNVPARFKFLKKDFTEAGYIEDAVTRIALANPDVSIKFINNNKIIFTTLGKGILRETVYEIFGKEIYQNLIDVEYEYESLKVKGVIGAPCISRSTRMHQFTYVNSRFIKDKVISSAIDRACLQKYAIGKFAFAVINLDISPKHVDVNVHPSKLEVKFDDESLVFEAIYHAIKNALEQDAIKNSPFTILKEEIKESKIQNEVVKPQVSTVIKENKFENVDNLNNNSSFLKLEVEKEEIKPQVDKKDIFVPYVAEEIKENIYDISYKNELKEESKKEENIEKQIEKLDVEVGTISNIETENIVKEDVVKNEIKEEQEEEYKPIFYKYVGQIFDTYIIIQIEDKMYVIDQHAAHERLLYEKIKKDYYSKNSNSQILLIPVLVELTSKEMEIVEQNMDMFYNTGFEIEKFGDKTIKISGVPNIGYDIDHKGLFLDIIDEIMGASKTYHTEKEERFIATLACKAAVKGHMNLSYKEQITLIDEMVKLQNPFNCPHGRPTAFDMSKYEIERRFLRK